jgi:hypothetical protein
MTPNIALYKSANEDLFRILAIDLDGEGRFSLMYKTADGNILISTLDISRKTISSGKPLKEIAKLAENCQIKDASFFDLDDKGMPSIIIEYKSGSNPATLLMGVLNIEENDHYFIKSIANQRQKGGQGKGSREYPIINFSGG